jgi:hypothetical protein
VLCLPFDEGSGTTAKDFSGYGNNGTLYGPTWVDGKYGKALSFDGVDDYVDCGKPTITGTFTVVAWAKVNDTGVRAVIGTRSPSDCGFDFKFQNGNVIHGDIGNGSGWITTSADAPFNYSLNTWYQVAYVVTKTGYIIYVNGNQIASGSYSESTPVLSDANHAITIGNTAVGGGEWFKGTIDEVRIYNRALSADEIKQHYIHGLPRHIYEDAISGEIYDSIPPGSTVKVVFPSPSDNEFFLVLSTDLGAYMSWRVAK